MIRASKVLFRLCLKLLRPIGYGAIGAILALITLFVVYLENRPDLSIWHDAELEAELGIDGKAASFTEYLTLESRVFSELEEKVLDRIGPNDRSLIDRYSRGSISDPNKWSPNWNRTFEFPADAPRLGVLLLHGMSDSPYSLRQLGESLHRQGAHVVGLRLPGHGTVPSGLVELRWEDMAAASDLALAHLRDKLGELPIYVVGYSTGAALAVERALRGIDDRNLPRLQGLVLISPAIGVTPVAAFAVWQGRLGHFLGLDKLAWTDISPEYDPFKYSSFAVNAGDQVYRITAEIASRLDALSVEDRLGNFPPVLAFQSAVDATVSAPALITGLFNKLPTSHNELVLFDINRTSETEAILGHDPASGMRALLQPGPGDYGTTLLTNESENSAGIVLVRQAAGAEEIQRLSSDMSWPRGVYSLSHIALPIPRNDPLYGIDGPGHEGAIRLGRIELRGERGILKIPASAMQRQRWNPFFPYIESRTLEFLGVSE